MVIIGIDPGTTRLGYGVIEDSKHGIKCLTYGILGTKGTSHTNNLVQISSELKKILARYKPSAGAVERLFFTANQKTGMAVSEVRGVVLLTLAERGMKITEFTPQEVKRSLSGYGGAGKGQIQNALRLILKMSDIIKPDDAADAVAIAICGATQKDY